MTEDSLNGTLPYSADAEKAVLSAIAQAPNTFLSDFAASIHPEAFFNEANRIIFAKMIEMYGKSVPIDIVTVTDCLRRSGLLDKVGGPAAVTEIFTFITSYDNANHYKNILFEKYRARRFIRTLDDGLNRLRLTDTSLEHESIEEIAAHLLNEMADISNDDGTPELPFTPIGTLVTKVIEQTAERAANPGRMLGVSYGFPSIDRDTSGVQPGQFITILGGTSMGKSILGRQILESWCEHKHEAVIYTWEMQDTQETTRMLCSQGSLSNETFKTGKFTRAEQDALVKSAKTVSEMPIAIVDCGGRYIEDVWRDFTRRSKRLPQGKYLLAEIDYLQLAPTKRAFGPKDRQKQIAYITQGCKQAAKSSKKTPDSPPLAAIIGLSQVNKDGDAREAEDIINDSDVAIKILARSADDADAKIPAWQRTKKPKDTPDDSMCDLFLAKVRDGKRYGKFPVIKIGNMFRFKELERD